LLRPTKDTYRQRKIEHKGSKSMKTRLLMHVTED